MDNPLEEIYQIFYNILVNPDKSLIEKEFNRCFTPDLELNHFLAVVPPKRGSRESIIRIFQCQRGFNENTGRMVLSATQYLDFGFIPWTTIPIKFVVILDLKQNEEKYLISKYEEFLQPEEIIVNRAICIRDGGNKIKVALKILHNSKDITDDFLKEVIFYGITSSNDFIIQCYGITKDPNTNNNIMVMEFAEDGSLHEDLVLNFDKITWQTKLVRLYCIATG
ncbi:5418_t:CDS:2, partial [Diversispora eburnea]